MKKVMVGISGGVDSATSCLILKEEGYDIAGCNINFIDEVDSVNNDALDVCNYLNIPFFILAFMMNLKKK